MFISPYTWYCGYQVYGEIENYLYCDTESFQKSHFCVFWFMFPKETPISFMRFKSLEAYMNT